MSMIRDWLAFQAVTLAPVWLMHDWRGGWRDRLFLALLPHAGAWAYRISAGEPE